MTLITNFLKKGDKVAVVAPAGRIAAGSLSPMLQCMKGWGLDPVPGRYVYAQYHTFAGTDEQRIEDLQWAVSDPEIKAVICARGGYGCSRIVDRVDFSSLLRLPKLLVGFSDITVLHARWHRLGLQSIHGVMSGRFPAGGGDNEATESLRKALFGEALHYDLPACGLNVPGEAEGVLVGGNLSIITHLTGSADAWDNRDKILFLEDLNEYLYALDRMMVHLQRAGQLSAIKGLVLGYFSDMKDGATPFGQTAYEIIDHYAGALGIPVCYGFPAGHEDPNLALPFGRPLKLSVAAGFDTPATLHFDALNV